MIKGKRIEAIFSIMFDRWCEDNGISQKSICSTSYQSRIPGFITMDDWKTATRDDYYRERSTFTKVDTNDLREHMEPIWMDEIGEIGIKESEYDADFIYSESTSLFSREYEKWKELQIENKIRETEHEIA